MRSYYAHLETLAPEKNKAIAPRPTFRSSAIFPVMQRPRIFSRILFMGYWMLKRNIRELACIITLRNAEGVILARRLLSIQDAKTYRIELSQELETAGWEGVEFIGSLEVEFFSTQNLVFPFPAVVINYYGPGFSSVVHTAQRIYNDYEDMMRNNQTRVPESGFNIYADSEREPFIGMINGLAPLEKSRVEMSFINHEQKILECPVDLGRLAPFETKILYPARLCDLKNFLNGRQGAGKIQFQLNWAFPRLLVGNIHHTIPAVTLTHTYYDCSTAQSDSDYWRQEEVGWHPAELTVPCHLANHHFTNIYFYPIFSPSLIALDLEIYNSEGILLSSKKNILKIQSPNEEFYQIPIKNICEELAIDLYQDYAIRLIAHPINSSRLPARIKLGLDIGTEFARNTPCNICTNLQPFNPSLENKTHSFRWTPILADQSKATVWIINSSPAVNYQRQAELSLTFFRERDTETLSRTLKIPPHGFIVLRVSEDKELMSFFEEKIGWMTAVTTNPYTGTYYFNENPSGVVGGDHGF